MFLILQNIKSLEWMNFMSSKLSSNKTGNSFLNLKPVQRRNGKSIPLDTVCPLCGTPHYFIYDNNGGNGQYQCKVCGHTLVPKKDWKFFRNHKCVNPKCPYYLHNLAKVDRKDLNEKHGKTKYKLHYIYRKFTVDFFTMD